MGMYLLASPARTLLVIALVIMVVVCLLFGFIVFMMFKNRKEADKLTVEELMQKLARRESKLNAEFAAAKTEARKNEVTIRLRRVKTAISLIDEIVKEEQAKAAAKKEDGARKSAPNGQRPAQKGQNGQHPAHRPADMSASSVDNAQAAENASEAATSAEQNEEKQSSRAKRKDDNEFKPFED